MGDAADWLTESMSDPESQAEYAMWDDGSDRKPVIAPAECVRCGVQTGPLTQEESPGWLCRECYDELQAEEECGYNEGTPRDSCDECGGDMEPDEGFDGLCDQCEWWRLNG